MKMELERSLIVVKPDGVSRGLAGTVISRFEQRGLRIVGMKMAWTERDFAERHYDESIEQRHGKKVREMLLKYLMEGPVIAFVVEGVSAVSIARKICGETYPDKAAPGTIRGDYAHTSKEFAITNDRDVKNLVHSSGTGEEAEREIRLWFNENELHSYQTAHEHHMY